MSKEVDIESRVMDATSPPASSREWKLDSHTNVVPRKSGIVSSVERAFDSLHSGTAISVVKRELDESKFM